MKKKTHGVQLLIRAIVRDPDGKIITDTGKKPSKSFVYAFLAFIGGMFLGTGDILIKAVTGANGYVYRYNSSAPTQFRVDAPINTSTYGVVVGTGDTAEDNEDHKLETQLTEGVGAGNITHASVVFEATAVVGANVDLVLKRAFSNATGSTITVKEAGIYTNQNDTWFHCIVRDVLPASIDVPNLCSLTIIYTMRTTV